MQRVTTLILVAVLCVLTSAPLTATGQGSSVPQIAGKFRKVAEPIPNRYFVVFKDEVARSTTGARAAKLARAHGGKLLHVYGSVLNGFAVELPEAAAVALSQNPLVKYVEEDFMLTATGTQATPQDSSFYGIDRIDQRFGLSGTYDYNRVGSGVHVYVLDTGVRTTHKEFGTRADVFRDYFGGPLPDNHGTFVAGIIGAKNYGVAKNTQIHSVRVCQSSVSCPATTVAAGVNDVVQFGSRPAVINMSISGRLPITNSSTMETAINNAMNAGVTCVAGAGNGHPLTGTPENVSNYTPARLANLITVGATDKFDNRASYSNFGSGIDLFAPGGEAVAGQFIPTPSAASDTDIDGFIGTSASSPHVAGIAALYLEANPSATHFQVRDQIVFNATNGAVFNAGFGSPTLMAYSGFVAPSPTNPIDDSRFFARQHYYDFLRREPDPGGWDFHTNFINACGADAACIAERRMITVRGFMESPEFRNTHTILRDNPVGSQAYNEEFIRQLYRCLLQREADPGGFDYHMTFINTYPGSYTTLIGHFIESPEYRSRFQ